MKKWIVLLFLGMQLSAFSQNTASRSIQEQASFTCDLISLDNSTNSMVLQGNVHFKTDRIELLNVDKIVYNRVTNEIVVTGFANYTLDGMLEVQKSGSGSILRYKIGESTAYIE